MYQTVVADPPWPFGDRLPGASRGAENNYEVMSIEEIGSYLNPDGVADDCRLFLWRVASMQEEALYVMRQWGFVPKTEIVWWEETVGGKPWFGMGRTVRASHEVCLIGQRGRPAVLSRSVRSVFSAGYTTHSEKPEKFYQIVETLSPGPYLELFARRQRVGWTCWGDELELS
jgi:N6-adenosine-specific RNA methylase IME4